MKTIHSMIEGPVTFERDTKMYGMVTGDLTIAQGVKAELYGMITGQLIIEPDADVTIFGMVAGGIFDKGGRICNVPAETE